jgi:hypothetical protein
MNDTPKKKQGERTGPKVKPMGFTNILLGVYWPAYNEAVVVWGKDERRQLAPYFTEATKYRARDIMEILGKPDARDSRRFLEILEKDPGFVSFVLDRFARISETGTATGKHGTVEAASIFRMIAVSKPELQDVEIVALAKKSKWAHHPKVKYATENHVTKALERGKVREKNQARLAEIQAVIDADYDRKEAIEASLSRADKRKLAACDKRGNAAYEKLNKDNDLESYKKEMLALREKYGELLDRIS